MSDQWIRSAALFRLFNPRIDEWEDDFRLDGAIGQPLTPAAAATHRLLRLNAAEGVGEGNVLQRLGRYPRE